MQIHIYVLMLYISASERRKVVSVGELLPLACALGRPRSCSKFKVQSSKFKAPPAVYSQNEGPTAQLVSGMQPHPPALSPSDTHTHTHTHTHTQPHPPALSSGATHTHTHTHRQTHTHTLSQILCFTREK